MIGLAFTPMRCVRVRPTRDKSLTVFHILKNFRETIERQLGRFEAPIRGAAAPIEYDPENPSIEEHDRPSDVATKERSPRSGCDAARQAMFDQVRTLYEAGSTVSDIARKLGRGHRRVGRWVCRIDFPERNVMTQRPEFDAARHRPSRAAWAGDPARRASPADPMPQPSEWESSVCSEPPSNLGRRTARRTPPPTAASPRPPPAASDPPSMPGDARTTAPAISTSITDAVVVAGSADETAAGGLGSATIGTKAGSDRRAPDSSGNSGNKPACASRRHA